MEEGKGKSRKYLSNYPLLFALERDVAQKVEEMQVTTIKLSN